ncbi:hypothetical protein D1007_09874 [Hordeum vulgare]|nr:hypothetical protein D1007_09874 [Hordeum vulgare]
MGERYPDDGVAANGFGRRHMHESEARLLYEADYLVSSDISVPSSWRLSTSADPVPAPSSAPDRRAEITRIRSLLRGTYRGDRPVFNITKNNKLAQ